MDKAIILNVVGYVLTNLGAIGAGVYVGHRFAKQIDVIYEKAEAVFGFVYGLVRPKAKAAGK